MIQIDKFRFDFPKLPEWKWWQYLITIVSIILALKINPESAYDLLESFVEKWTKGP